MIFYEIRGSVTEKNPSSQTETLTKETITEMAFEIDMFSDVVFEQKIRLDIVNLGEGEFRIVAIADFEILERYPLNEHCKMLLDRLGYSCEIDYIREIEINLYKRALTTAGRKGFCTDPNQVRDDFQVDYYSNDFRYINRKFDLLTKDQEDNLQNHIESLAVDGLQEEIQRIIANPKYGTPVHYIIKMEDILECKHIYNLLLAVMYKHGRIKRQVINIWGNECVRRGSCVSRDDLNALYNQSKYGAVIIRSTFNDETIDNYGSTNQDVIKTVGRIIQEQKKDVLTILCVEKKNEKQLEIWKENLDGMTFVEISEKIMFKDECEAYLLGLAEKDKAQNIDGLFETIEQGVGYTRFDLDKIYSTWFSNYQKTYLFPAYKDLTACERKSDAEMKGKAHTELANMIGLENIKAQIQDIINFARVQKMFKDKGIKQTQVCNHMVFTGNPGTAKTTIARLFAQIMKDNNLLNTGRFVECGRANLIGQFVGQTAPLVKQRFKEAKGGVLFIDEAYSLVDDKKGMFGDEAINTIVQEMENSREDTIVIFAGYKKEMEHFINRNSGLKSRIAHYVDFPDYDTKSLADILCKMIAEQKLSLIDTDKILSIMEKASKCENFGNGRFARNLLDKARLRQATRISKLTNPTIDHLTQLLPEDFELPEEYTKQKQVIGF